MTGPDPDPLYLQEIEGSIAAIVREAGQVALRHFQLPLQVEYKQKDRSDPVTLADREVEEHLRSAIAREFPDHGILGEEGTQVEVESRDYLWVLDPVDGTTNFLNGLPLFGCSAGLLHKGKPVAGAIFLPVAPRPAARCAPPDGTSDSGPLQLGGAVLHARLRGGTWLDGERVQASDEAMPQPTSLVGLPGHHSRQFQRGERMRQSPGEVRCLGSVTYETAMVACGILRYSIFRGPWLWDMAAGTLLVKEAGGEALIWKGNGWEPLVRFKPMASRKDPKDVSLRHWNATVLVGGGKMAWFVADRVRPGRGLLGRLADRFSTVLAKRPRR